MITIRIKVGNTAGFRAGGMLRLVKKRYRVMSVDSATELTVAPLRCWDVAVAYTAFWIRQAFATVRDVLKSMIPEAKG